MSAQDDKKAADDKAAADKAAADKKAADEKAADKKATDDKAAADKAAADKKTADDKKASTAIAEPEVASRVTTATVGKDKITRVISTIPDEGWEPAPVDPDKDEVQRMKDLNKKWDKENA